MVDQTQITPTTISNLVENQFPAFYREQGPKFVKFVQAYYQWLESPNNPNYYTRRYYNIMDIDLTLDQFILHFKEKYLKNIQLTTESDTRLLIKHALDIYRSKGTERCIELLFQLVFSENVDFYYPSQDLLKLSDGIWFRPTYLELSLSENNILIINKEIQGVTSGAVAFVDDVVRRRSHHGGRLIDVAYISALSGNFVTGERIIPQDGSLDISLCPAIIGSLTSITFPSEGAGANYNVGDIVNIDSASGDLGVGRISSITQASGLVNLTLEDGGWGYTSNGSTIYISSELLSISNVSLTNSSAISWFRFLETITQPLAYLNYRSANGTFSALDSIFTYNGVGAVTGQATILSVTQSNSTTGTLVISPVSGNIASNTQFYKTANAVTANQAVSNGYLDISATAQYIANNTVFTLTVDVANNFVVGENIFQGDVSGTITQINGSNLVVNNTIGMFRSNIAIYSDQSNTSATIQNLGIAFTVGVVNVNNSFVSLPGNYIKTNDFSGNLVTITSGGSGLSAAYSNTLLNTETITWANDKLSTYSSVHLNANTYGFPANTTANASHVTIYNSLTHVNTTFGKISSLQVLGLGKSYVATPMIVIDEPKMSYDTRLNQVLYITGATAAFTPGETISQSSTGALGVIEQPSNSTYLTVQRNRYYTTELFVATTNATTQIIGSLSGSVANVSLAIYDYSGTDTMGRNAIVQSSFITGNGVVVTAEVIDSGFGYIDGESVTLTSNTSSSAVGIGHLGKQGYGSGFYRKKGGFLSDQKKLFDGYFWQNYSYQIVSRKMIDKYQQMVQSISHPAGTIMFGKYVHDNKDNRSVAISKSVITLS